jgi:hypothetical protein
MSVSINSSHDPIHLNPVGKSVPRIEGKGIVTGQTKYVFDVSFPNMLVGKMIRSPYPHAKIKNRYDQGRTTAGCSCDYYGQRHVQHQVWIQ